MAAIHLITGGARSGKSDHALQLAEEHGGSRAYIATCPVEDEEMRRRVEKHRQRRRNRGWHTIEERTDLARTVREAEQAVLLIDCLTLWVSNLMTDGNDLTEERMEELSSELLDACRGHGGPCYIVTNEVGMGVVPGNRAARRFRDLAGRANQAIAAGADRVTLMICGIATQIKSEGQRE
jgi:adenosylcobinamide kinase/adenosylcobinamide-phosphate guanylyltransferase